MFVHSKFHLMFFIFPLVAFMFPQISSYFLQFYLSPFIFLFKRPKLSIFLENVNKYYLVILNSIILWGLSIFVYLKMAASKLNEQIFCLEVNSIILEGLINQRLGFGTPKKRPLKKNRNPLNTALKRIGTP